MSGRSTGTRHSAALRFSWYALLLAAAVAILFTIDHLGRQLQAPSGGLAIHTAPPGQSADTLFRLLLALTVITVTAHLMGVCFTRLGQPAVIGEVVGGIMLGPSLLGRVAPALYSGLLPPVIAPILAVYAQLGIILYMFLVGLELDLGVIRERGPATIGISHASIVVPFLLGSALALVLYPILADATVSFTVFSLFLGVSMSITAFPVLARILTDWKINRSPLGTLALACAAAGDATAWCLLAFVVSVAQAHAVDAVRTLALTAAFVAIVLALGAPLARRIVAWLEQSPSLSHTGLTLLLVTMLVAAMATEYIGIHALFGAFLLGAIIPHHSRTATELNDRLHGFVGVFFLPAFFALTGMRTELALISGAQSWLLCGAIILVACAGKFGGTLAAARRFGFSWQNAAALGILMNTRGLVELIVLNIGVDLHVISPTLFTMLVVMALVTTIITSPLLRLVLRGPAWADLQEAAARVPIDWRRREPGLGAVKGDDR